MNVVVIGLGRWGKVLLKSAREVGIRVVGIYDTDKDVLGQLNTELGGSVQVPRGMGLVAFLRYVSPDAVLIATPPPTHVETVKTCLDLGLSVFCEKPLAMSVKDLDALKVPTGKVLQCGYQFSHMPMLNDLTIECKHMQVRALWYNQGPVRKDIGGILNTLVHPASVLVAMFWNSWERIEHVTSLEDVLSGDDMPGACTVVGTLATGWGPVRYLFDTSWRAHRKIREFTFISNGKEFVYDDIAKTLSAHSKPTEFYSKALQDKFTPVQRELLLFADAVKGDTTSIFSEPEFSRRVLECLGLT